MQIRTRLSVPLLTSWSITLNLLHMSNDQKAIYVGSGTEKFDGDLIEISVCLTDLPQEHRFEYNGKWYTKLKVSKKKSVDDYGKTHAVSVNTWKPEQKAATPQPKQVEMADDGELPF